MGSNVNPEYLRRNLLVCKAVGAHAGASSGTMNNLANGIPQTQCPECGVWVDDYDGFGVLAHSECGYCCHPSSTNGVCGICGASTNDTEVKP